MQWIRMHPTLSTPGLYQDKDTATAQGEVGPTQRPVDRIAAVLSAYCARRSLLFCHFVSGKLN